MGLRLFQKFSMVWEQFEQQIKTEFLKRFQADEIYQPETHPRALSALYDTVGWRYWKYSAAGAPWFQQFEELFFDSQYYKFREKFYRYCGLDAMAAERLPQLPDKTATQVYTQILKPCLDARKQEIQKDFQYLELQLHHPVSYTFTIGDENWKFEVSPKSGWRNATLLIIIIGMFLTISLLLSVLTRIWLVENEHKKKFQILARTDSLTNIYNRYGFDEFAEKMIQKNPKAHFVAALLDIDDFKFINDIYGHNYGDRALKNLADSMKTFFPSDALLGRNGGDEFCILLPNCTFAEAAIQLQKFTKLPKSFSYHGKEHAFYISLGYAEYPTFASNRSQLMRCADAALYEIKLHGKNGCMVYREGIRTGARKQLGFAFKDISEHLPGAFIIYRADKEDDELFFANDEFLHMSGYKDIDELFRLTEKSFRNLIREDEQQQIESSIWEQIDNGNENDYIHFHLRKADGTYFSVLDHGRIVESPQYGKVFYVLFMDWEDMHIRYNDKFAR